MNIFQSNSRRSHPEYHVVHQDGSDDGEKHETPSTFDNAQHTQSRFWIFCTVSFATLSFLLLGILFIREPNCKEKALESFQHGYGTDFSKLQRLGFLQLFPNHT
jgi:hypothetical protein